MRMGLFNCLSSSYNSSNSRYIKLGEYYSAINSLRKYSEYNDLTTDEAYYYLMSKAYYSIGCYQYAYDNLTVYSDISDSLDMVKMSQEVNSVKEQFENELFIQKQHKRLSSIVFLFVLFIIAIAIFLFQKQKEERRLRQKYNDLKEEYEYLNETKKNCQTKMISLADEETLKILDRRIKALGTFLSKDKPDSLSKVADKLEDLSADKNIVTDSIGMLYAIYHPSFVLKLEEYGLTASEVGFCCLLLLGLRTSELSSVVNKSNTYNISSRLRSKLGLGHSPTRLSIWLRQIYNETEA